MVVYGDAGAWPSATIGVTRDEMAFWSYTSADMDTEEAVAGTVHTSAPLRPPRNADPVEITTFGSADKQYLYPDGTILTVAPEGPSPAAIFRSLRVKAMSMRTRRIVRCRIGREEMTRDYAFVNGQVCAKCVPSQGTVRPGRTFSWAGGPRQRILWRMMIQARDKIVSEISKNQPDPPTILPSKANEDPYQAREEWIDTMMMSKMTPPPVPAHTSFSVDIR